TSSTRELHAAPSLSKSTTAPRLNHLPSENSTLCLSSLKNTAHCVSIFISQFNSGFNFWFPSSENTALLSLELLQTSTEIFVAAYVSLFAAATGCSRIALIALCYCLILDLDSALRESSAKWKIVVGHHTIKSAGHHGNTKELEVQLLPILEANNVDFYLNGHDHCLEHISSSDSPLQFLTSGGGSKSWRGDINWWNPKEMKFYYDGQGFLAMQITQTQVFIQFFDIFGNILHKWTSSKNLFSII
ncbi:hypothetical protein HAX54_050687, partial [Datura stramonium]|nr:hypothetical protein [Datura stramonium]